MKLQNTSAFPDGLVREVYRFVKPNGVSVPRVIVRNRTYGLYSGHSYQRSRIVVSIGSEPRLGPLRVTRLKAATRPNGGGYLDFTTLTTEESLVAVMAHELRHQYQGMGKTVLKEKDRIVYSDVAFAGETIRTGHTTHFNARRIRVTVSTHVRRRGMVWGARGRFSERDCDAYALRMLRAWRRAHRAEPTLPENLFEVSA